MNKEFERIESIIETFRAMGKSEETIHEWLVENADLFRAPKKGIEKWL
jgi:hypothetical protein